MDLRYIAVVIGIFGFMAYTAIICLFYYNKKTKLNTNISYDATYLYTDPRIAAYAAQYQYTNA